MRRVRLDLVTLVLAPMLLLGSATLHADEGRLFDPVFREGAPSDELVEGEPSLSRGHVNAFVDLLEAAFDLGLTQEQERLLRDRVEINFAAAEADARQEWLTLVDPMPVLKDRARAGNREVVVQGLREFRRKLDERMRARPDHTVHVLVADVLTKRHEVLWPGDPPIPRGQADLYLEMALFVSSLGRGVAFEPTAGQLDALREDLTTALHREPREIREKIEAVHRTWLAAKAAWDRGGDARRFPFRWRAVELVAASAKPGTGLEIEVGSTLKDYAREAAKVAAAVKPYDAFANVARNPKALFEAVVGGLKIDPASKEFTFQFR
jgi:hypothetical protein